MAFWTAEREDQFRALAVAGKTAREIALELGCSRSTVHDRARLLDLVLPTPADPETDRDGKPKALLDADAELVALLRVYHPERETGLSRRA
jgi:transposase